MGEESRFDVVVVGAGGSGLAAAVSAAEGGARVVALERREEPGGTTRIAVGSFTANRTRMQAGAGISDALDDHADDVGRFAPPEIEARNNADLRRYFLSREFTRRVLDRLLFFGQSEIHVRAALLLIVSLPHLSVRR